jgi:hypothetical protein
MLVKLVRQIPWVFLGPVAILLGMAPFKPEPHLFEKLRMLFDGQLIRPVDVFDLFMHGTPLLLVIIKLLLGRDRTSSTTPS